MVFAPPSVDGSATDSSSNKSAEHSNGIVVVQVPVSAELFNTFYRRGRRRLYDLQDSCECNITPNRNRGTLRVRGTMAAVQKVKLQLSMLEGPVRNVSTALWSELMRTRTVADPTRGSIAWLQDASGIRVHVERQRHEVRLFGEPEGVRMVDRMLATLDSKCIELVEKVDTNMIDVQVFKCIAQKFGVTLMLETDSVMVRGRMQFVKDATAKLRRLALKPNISLEEEFGDMPDDEFKDTPEWWNNNPNGPGLLLSLNKPMPAPSQASVTPDIKSAVWPGHTQHGTNATMPNMKESKSVPRSTTSSRDSQGMGNLEPVYTAAEGMNPKPLPQKPAASVCHECGCAAFCSQCGHSLRPVMPLFMSMPANMAYFQGQNGGMPCINSQRQNMLYMPQPLMFPMTSMP